MTTPSAPGSRSDPRSLWTRCWCGKPVTGERPVARWADATDLPAALRAALDREFPLARLEATAHQVSKDGTEKFLWKLADGEAVESVLIPEGRRGTLCISSPVGGALRCRFCP